MLSFKKQITEEFNEIVEKGNKAVIKVSKASRRVAITATPRDTGRAENGWFLNTGQGSGLIPSVGNYGQPKSSNFTFQFKKEPTIRLFNNVPYISYLEYGQGRGKRTPHKMLFKAKIYFEANMQREFNKIK